MGRRTLLLIASILVAALGTALIWLYVQGADTRAQAGEAQVTSVSSRARRSHPARRSAISSRATVNFPQSFVAGLRGTPRDRLHRDARLRADPHRRRACRCSSSSSAVRRPRRRQPCSSTPTSWRSSQPAGPAAARGDPPARVDRIRIFVAREAGRGKRGAGASPEASGSWRRGPPPERPASPADRGQRRPVPQANVTLDLGQRSGHDPRADQASGGGRALWFGLLPMGSISKTTVRISASRLEP